MNENHQRHLLVTFRHIDHLLSEAEHVLASAGGASPFAEYTQDSTPVQRKVIHDYIQRVREAMAGAMADLRLPRPTPVCGALWAVRGHITFAIMAVTEMEPQRIRGYGAISEADRQAIDRMVAELNAALERLAAYLDKGPDADLQARLQKLEQTRDEVPLLRELERVITTHGLVEFRASLTMLLDRMEDGCFEIGIFGRVSSGKSSLLNHLLGVEVLPVGVTPVTAIPTRVRFGATPRAVIEFADRPPVQVELPRLAEFSTEQHNPGNTRHVARILVEVPAARLRDGVTFVDTPGLGSLATSGAEETMAYLPRCDLGLVLVDAASTLTPEDLAVVQALYQAGAKVMLLVSKADLLPPPDRERALNYVRNQVRAEVNVEPPVHPVSVAAAEAPLCDEWYESQLRPLLEAHRELTASSRKRKIGGLREALLATLKRRVNSAAPGLSTADPARANEAESALRGVSQMLKSKRREIEDLAHGFRETTDAVTRIAAEELAAVWLAGDWRRVNLAEHVTSTVSRLLAEESARVAQRVEQVRAELDGPVQNALRLLPSARPAIQELPKVAELPLLDASIFKGKVTLRRPVWARFLGRSALRRHIQRELSAQVGPELCDLLSTHCGRLTRWAKSSLDELEAAFSANAGILQAPLARRYPSANNDGAGLRSDILLLGRWAPVKTPQLPPA